MVVQPLQVLVTGRSVNHQTITLIAAVDDHVVNDPALLVQHGAVQGFARLSQTIDVIGQQTLQPDTGLVAMNIDNGHVGNIEHPAVTAHLMVLLDLGAVMQGHVPTAKIDHLGA
ncbi:hypothetical protein D3C80_1318930 [compost metagenome]